MNIKNIFKAVACAMLMPAVLLTTSCSKGDDAVTNPEKPATTEAAVNKGYALPVTVNVTRQDNGTRATFDGSKLNFSGGDKLFVYGSATAAGSFAGELTWQSGGTFSGTIYTENSYEGTADALFTDANEVYATLLPNGYESYNFLSIIEESPALYDDRVIADGSNAFVASETAKATGVAQLSYERASTYNSGIGFALAPLCAILNFTISGLEAGAKDVSLKMHLKSDYTVTGSVTPNASGVATFAIGVPVGSNISSEENNLTVGSSKFTLPSSTTFTAGKIYNITRVANAINGQFSVSSTDKVYFSKGNLRYVSGSWSFFDHQYDCYDDYSSDARDKFGWSTSSTTFGMSTSSNISDYSGSFVDWGTVPGIGEGWYTLSHEEWYYLFNERTDATSKYGFAKISTTEGDVHGIIILPDAFVDPNKNNGSNAFVGSTTDGWNANKYTAENWALMEAAGAVFLPAAGFRDETTVKNVGSYGYYWSSSPDGEDGPYSVYFYSDYLDADYDDYRFWGQSVRLVRNAN